MFLIYHHFSILSSTASRSPPPTFLRIFPFLYPFPSFIFFHFCPTRYQFVSSVFHVVSSTSRMEIFNTYNIVLLALSLFYICDTSECSFSPSAHLFSWRANQATNRVGRSIDYRWTLFYRACAIRGPATMLYPLLYYPFCFILLPSYFCYGCCFSYFNMQSSNLTCFCSVTKKLEGKGGRDQQ